MANITLTAGITNNGQFPVDGKTYFLTIADMQDLGNSDANAYIYYENMIAICNENGSRYKWREEETSGEEGLLTTSFTYPNGIISNGIDYSNRIFNFFLIEDESVFETSLGTTQIPSDWYENAVGISASDLDGLSLTEVIETLFIPTVNASISQEASVLITGVTTSTQEVGTAITQNTLVTLDQGEIINGDGSVAGDLIGDLDTVTINLPDGSQGYNNDNASGNNDLATTSAYNVTQGTNTWTVIVTNNVGTTTYTDNKGGTETVASIESAKADTTRDNVTFSLSAAYNRYHYSGVQGGSPTTSAGVRALTSGLLSTSNTGSWDVDIEAGADYAEFSFYAPSGRTIKVVDTGNLNLDITADFVETSITVEDAGGNNVAYSKYTNFIGAVGFTNPTNFEITIT